uniref:Epithelial cell transforming 2 like n=1 Tax=Electrophorus electricus TaxID=8005 RepID=A0A4W4HJM7_ELEEL
FLNFYRPDESCSKTAATRFSAWTPVTNKAVQLFQDRTTLILHWFDLWTDQQRKHFLHLVLRRCSKSQIKFISAYFMETVPVSRVDFTTVLPRFLSLYILSFLSPMDLCAAAQVSWYWRFLSEQDCLWSLKCVRRGWFLPHSPANNEFGAWKKHYIACAASLDFLSPREAAGIYGTMNEALTEPEEQEERRTEHMIRNTIRKKLAQHKGELKVLLTVIYPYYIYMYFSTLNTVRKFSKKMFDGMTLEALLSLVQSAVQGRPIQSVGIMADGSTEEIYFIEGIVLRRSTL